MERTENYQLCLWDPEDKVLRTDFNEDNEKIEQALAELETDKAEQTALSALVGQVTALEQGQLRFKFDTYAGNDEAGSSHPTRLDFDFKPLMLLIIHPSSQYYGGFPWLRNMSQGRCFINSSGNTNYLRITWEDRAVQWYSPYSNAEGADQLNAKGTTYRYLALGIAE